MFFRRIRPHFLSAGPRRSGRGSGDWRLATFLVALSSLVLALGQAPPQADPQKVWALLIGVSNYVHAEPLLYAASDAQALSDFVASPRGGGIPADHIFTLLEDGATQTAVLNELEQMGERVKDGDTVYIYVAGHGFINPKGIGYFIPSDGNLRALAATAVSFTQLKELIEVGLANAGRRVLVTDLCNAGRIGPGKSELAQSIQNLVNAELLKVNPSAGGTFLNLLASRPTEASWEMDELGRGVFTHTLLEALNGKAGSGPMTVARAAEVVQYILTEVPKYTGNAQHPVSNSDFDPNMPLAFPDRPGPVARSTSGGVVLELLHTDKTAFARVQWTDPKTSSMAVRQIPRDRPSVQIGSLLPGELELTFFDEANRGRPLKVTLQQGRNTVDVTRQLTGSLRRPRGAYRTASLAAPTLQAQLPARLAAAAAEATLLLRLQQGTEVYIDGSFFGSSGPASRFLQLQGLSAGVHTVRLVPSPEREHRFRVKLFSGPQILETSSGELRPLLEIKSPPEQLPPPANLPPASTDLYRRFERALWEESLLAPPGDSAWDLYQQLSRAVPAALDERLRTRLVVALGDRAQLTILKYLRGGDTRWNAAEFEEGAALLARVQQLLPSNRSFDSRQRFFVGRALIERGQYAQAAPELQRAVNQDPDASYSHNALALALWKQNLLDQAIVPLRQAIELSPTWTYPRNTLALIYLEQRRYTEAEQEFQSSLQMHAEDSTGHHGIAQLYFLTGRWQQAEESLRRALEFNPGNAYAYETLGRLYQRLQRPADAENAFRLAIRLEPAEPSFHLSLADLLRQVGRPQQARPIIARLQSDHPNNPQVLVGDAILLAAEGKPVEAEASFARALRQAPRDSNLRVQYGLFLRQRGSAEQAAREFREALRIAPSNAFAHYNLAVIHLSQQKISDAEKALEQSLRSDTRLAAPRFLLGKIRAAQNRHREALEQFRQALPLSIEPAQRQEIEEAAIASERAVVGQRIEQAKTRVERKDYGRAWTLYAEILKDAPDSIDVRDAVFDLRAQWLEAPVAELPSSRLAAALQTGFWKAQAQAEVLWNQGGKDAAFRSFLAAVENLQSSEWKIIAASSLNYRNRNHSVHEWIYRWGRRLVEERRYDALLQLMEAAVRHKLFAPVPGLAPVTLDNLMVPADVADPKQFSDFEVEYHPDPRAHELYALAWAGRGDMERARTYLAALQGTPHLARIQQELDRVTLRERR